MSRSRWIEGIGFLYLLILLMPVSNFAYSVIFALAVLMCLASYRQIKGIHWRELHKPLVYTLIYFVASIFLVALPFDAAVMKETKRYLSWLIPCIPVMIMAMQKDLTRAWEWAAVIAGIVLSTPVLYDTWVLHTFRSGGFSVSPNETALYLEFSIPLIVAAIIHKSPYTRETKIRRILAVISLILVALAIMYGASRGGIIGIVLGGAISTYLVGWRTWSRKIRGISLVMIAIVVLVIGLLFPVIRQDAGRSYDNERLLLIESSYAMWLDHPIIGVGFSNWKENYNSHYILPEAKEPELDMPHNTIALFFSTTGVVGGIAFLVLMGSTIVVLVRQYHRTGDAVYLYILWAFIAAYTHGLVDSGITNKAAMREFSSFYGLLIGYLYYKKVVAHR